MAEADRVRLSYIKEVTWGTHPGTTMTVTRYASESLKQTTSTSESPEIGSRRTKDVARSNIQADGSTNCIFSATTFDEWLRSCLCADADWTTQTIATDNTIAATAGTNTWTGTGEYSGVSVGDIVQGTGWTDALNNKAGVILTNADANTITVSNALATESAGAGKGMKFASQITDGSTAHSFGLEKEFQDIASLFQEFSGAMITGVNFAADTGGDGLVACNWNWLAKSMTLPSSSTGSGYTAANGNKVANIVDHVENTFEGSASSATSSFQFDIDNSLRARQVLGTLGAESIKLGSLKISGSIARYFASSALLAKYIAFTESSLTITIAATGGTYVFHFPAVQFSDGEALAGGKDQDVIARLPFIVKEHSTQAKMIRIGRIT